MPQSTPRPQSQQQPEPRWILLAIASGAFAALNGLFAKLYELYSYPFESTSEANTANSTTDEQTTTFANAMLSLFGAPGGAEGHPVFMFVVRGVSCLFLLSI